MPHVHVIVLQRQLILQTYKRHSSSKIKDGKLNISHINLAAILNLVDQPLKFDLSNKEQGDKVLTTQYGWSTRYLYCIITNTSKLILEAHV